MVGKDRRKKVRRREGRETGKGYGRKGYCAIANLILIRVMSHVQYLRTRLFRKMLSVVLVCRLVRF
jgi:hypothetical protein